MELNNLKRNIYFLLLIIVIAFLAFLKLPSKIDIPVKIFPGKEWLVVQPAPGQYYSVTKDYLNGRNNQLMDFVADRGEQVKCLLIGELFSGQSVDSNTVVGKIISSGLREKILRISNQIKIKQAELAVFSTGEKPEIIRIFENEYSGLLKQLKIEQTILARKEELLSKNLISPQEYQIQQSKIVQLQSEVNALKSRIEGLKSGAKQQQIDLIKTQITSLMQQLAFLQNQDSSLVLKAPFSGTVLFHFQSDTLLHLIDDHHFVGLFLIPFQDSYQNLIRHEVNLKNENQGRLIKGRILRFEKKVLHLSGKNMMYGILHIEEVSNTLLPGLILRGQLTVAEKRIWQYVWHFFKSFFTGNQP